VGTKRREAAPNAEWVLMYRGGLTRGQIAKLVGAATSTVDYHLTIARSTDPGLQSAHGAAAALQTRHAATPQGLDHTRELLAFVKETGRYPSRTGGTLTERTLAAWLQRRREDARDGTLARAYGDALAELSGWQTPVRAEADEARWAERLAALVEFRAAGNDWPRHKAVITGEEHDLGVWLHFQRSKSRRSELAAEKVQALDRAVPGWRAGRPRGRRKQLR
jgi:hypothetical protein